MRTIPLRYSFEAVVDDEDYERLSEFKWYYDERNDCVYTLGGIAMSHKILRTSEMIDHRNGKGLDNRRSNLRECTYSQNAQNKRKSRWGVYSKYKGVCFDSRNKRWQARICLRDVFDQRISRYLGNFVTEEEAAETYDKAARRHFGEFAALNFPGEAERSCLRG